MLVGTACLPDGEQSRESNVADIPAVACQWASTAPRVGEDRIAACDLEFREVLRLEGQLDGVAPHEPIAVLGDGRYVTGTYSPGKMAVWGPDGGLRKIIGRGPGEGPGEFEHPSDLVQITEDELVVFTGHRLVHVYSTDGRFRRSLRFPSAGGAARGVGHDDVAISWAGSEGVRQGFLLQGASVRAFSGVQGRLQADLSVAAAADIGVWSAESDRYVLRRHRWPDGVVVDSIVRNPDWFHGPDGLPANLYKLQSDGRGLIWAVMGVADANAPSGPVPAGGDPEEYRDITDRYFDHVVEAVTPSGRLVASARFDGWRDTAYPIGRDLWYRRSEDLVPAMVILKAELTMRR